MTANQAKRSGNTFIVRAVTALVLVHFLILSRMPAAKTNLNQSIGQVEHALKTVRRQAQGEIDTLKFQRREQLRAAYDLSFRKAMAVRGRNPMTPEVTAVQAEKAPSLTPSPSVQTAKPGIDSNIDAKISALQLRIADLDRHWIALEQAKYERTFKIPGTEASLGESDVKKLYPLALALMFLPVGLYRRAILRAPQSLEFTPPFWAAPIPLQQYPLRLFHWLALNVGGLTFFVICCVLFLDFARRDEFFSTLPWIVVNTVAGGGVLCFYIWQTLRAVFPRATEVQGRAATA
jgi:hypothetical protein